MSKIRIYELAKELGVDNKVVISRAMELGLQGIKSHSNTLDSSEAEQIRRAIIRQTVGEKPSGNSETVTKRVDQNTGNVESIVERRRGNVIMRRRQADAPGATIQETDQRANAAEVLEAETETLENNSAALLHKVQDSQIEKAEEAIAKTASVDLREKIENKDSEPEESTEQDKKNIGPKILGKIELPVKKAKPQVENKTERSSAKSNYTQVEVEEEEGRKKGSSKSKSKKRELSRFDLVDYEGRELRRSPKPSKQAKKVAEEKQAQEVKATKASKRVVKIGDGITVGELAKQMSLKVGEVISKLMSLGIMATINQFLDKDTASVIAEEFEFQVESTSFDETEVLAEEVDSSDSLKSRPPVVTVMGHVDHGKTSLLDYIRKASVAVKEHGGITQHIGAYQVELQDHRLITFIDTPGHAAFTQMRARGANVTDIVILVVAADDGVMPQTVEAINHAKAAEVPIVVAVNKIDKNDANQDRIKQQLVEHGLQPEDWGGDTMFFGVSALKGTGVKELLEGVLLQAEVKELKANPDRRAKGIVIESRQDRGRGNVATVLVQSGTLRIGDTFVVGPSFGRVRSMLNDMGEKLDIALPATPVEITGFDGFPEAGDDLIVTESEAKAREIATNRAEKRALEERALASGPISLEEFSRRASNVAAAELNVIVKADVHGSLEAVKSSIEQLATEKVKVKVLHSAVGGVTESDIQLAIASQAIIVAFNVRAEPRAMQAAENAGIQVRFYRIIYELIDDVRSAMTGLLAPIKQEVVVGRAEVRDTFTVPKIGTIAGSYVVDGIVKRGSFARVVRDSRVIFEGKMASLRRFKDDVKEVQKGYECGIGIENFNDVKVGDVLEIYEEKEIAASLD